MMLLANEVVAKDLRQREVPAIYRVHGKPDATKLAHFATLASSLGHDLDVESAGDSRALSTFLRKIESTPEAPVLRYLLLRAMQQAIYSTSPDIGHFGLAASDYLHFTSPIRRYPDLAVHRVVRMVARSEPIDAAVLVSKLRIAATESSRLERRAMIVERDVVDLYRAILMRDRIDDELDAQVTSVDEHGFYVVFDEPVVEALIPAEALGEELELDDLGLRVTARRSGRTWSLGDRMKVRIVEVRIQDRKVVAIPASQRERAPSAPRQPQRRDGAPGRRDGGKTKIGRHDAAPKRKGDGGRPPKKGGGRSSSKRKRSQ
jgi:ribonuclease R